MKHRVVHWGTGNTGGPALRGVINHPDLELVGLLVHNPAKVGKDAGELCGIDPVGVEAIADPDTLLAIDADCLVYMGDYPLRPAEAIGDACRFLQAGRNVVSTSFLDWCIRRPLPRMFASRSNELAQWAARRSFATAPTQVMPAT